MSKVPNTDNFNLEDVVAAVGSHATVSRDLNDCFLKANASYFDPAYNNNTYAGETTGKSLKRFRNYTPVTPPTTTTTTTTSLYYYYQASQFTCPPSCAFVGSGYIIASATPLTTGKYYNGGGSIYLCNYLYYDLGGSIFISDTTPYNTCGDAICVYPTTTTTTTLQPINFTISWSCLNGGTVTISSFTGGSSYLMSQQLHTSYSNAASGYFISASQPYSYQNAGNGNWYVGLKANDGSGRILIKSTTVACEVTTTTTTLAQPEPWLPEGFSPNGDGIHDYFQPLNLEYYTNNQMSIYNGCGNLMYQTTNYHLSSNWWDGKMKESSRWGSNNCSTIYYTQGSDVPVGNYVWILYINGSEYSNGTVMVAR